MNFVHSLPLVAISVGLLIKKVPVIGIIYNPLLDQMFTAKLGQGAFLNGHPIHVSAKEGERSDAKMNALCVFIVCIYDTRSFDSFVLSQFVICRYKRGARVFGGRNRERSGKNQSDFKQLEEASWKSSRVCTENSLLACLNEPKFPFPAKLCR